MLTVTCTTSGCHNEGISIDLDVPEDEAVICGVCDTILNDPNGVFA